MYASAGPCTLQWLLELDPIGKIISSQSIRTASMANIHVKQGKRLLRLFRRASAITNLQSTLWPTTTWQAPSAAQAQYVDRQSVVCHTAAVPPSKHTHDVDSDITAAANSASVSQCQDSTSDATELQGLQQPLHQQRCQPEGATARDHASPTYLVEVCISPHALPLSSCYAPCPIHFSFVDATSIQKLLSAVPASQLTAATQRADQEPCTGPSASQHQAASSPPDDKNLADQGPGACAAQAGSGSVQVKTVDEDALSLAAKLAVQSAVQQELAKGRFRPARRGSDELSIQVTKQVRLRHNCALVSC